MTEPPHALSFLPLPQGQRSLRPTRVALHTGWAVASPSSAWVNPLLDLASEAGSWNRAVVSSAGVCGRLCRNCLRGHPAQGAEEEAAADLRLDVDHQGVEPLEGLGLVLDEPIPLAVGAEADGVAQRIHPVEVFLPEAVDGIDGGGRA